MDEKEKQMEDMLRQGFIYINRFMLVMWRLGLGPWVNIWPAVIGRIMVITHKGRKSGLSRQTPVNYTIIDRDIYCTAAFGEKSDWYQNMMQNPEVEVWLPGSWWEGLAQDISDSEMRSPYLRQVLIASGFAARAVGINPHTMPDDKFEEVTESYRLIRIQRREARTGKGGPGDLAWVWPITTMILIPVVFLLKKRK